MKLHRLLGAAAALNLFAHCGAATVNICSVPDGSGNTWSLAAQYADLLVVNTGDVLYFSWPTSSTVFNYTDYNRWSACDATSGTQLAASVGAGSYSFNTAASGNRFLYFGSSQACCGGGTQCAQGVQARVQVGTPPTAMPTHNPTMRPTQPTTWAPTLPTGQPTRDPTAAPIVSNPTGAPVVAPTAAPAPPTPPTPAPTIAPSPFYGVDIGAPTASPRPVDALPCLFPNGTFNLATFTYDANGFCLDANGDPTVFDILRYPLGDAHNVSAQCVFRKYLMYEYHGCMAGLVLPGSGGSAQCGAACMINCTTASPSPLPTPLTLVNQELWSVAYTMALLPSPAPTTPPAQFNASCSWSSCADYCAFDASFTRSPSSHSPSISSPMPPTSAPVSAAGASSNVPAIAGGAGGGAAALLLLIGLAAYVLARRRKRMAQEAAGDLPVAYDVEILPVAAVGADAESQLPSATLLTAENPKYDRRSDRRASGPPI